MHIARHLVPQDTAAKCWTLSWDGVQTTLERVVGGDESGLSMLETAALGAAQAAVVLDPASSDAVRALRLAARSGEAMWMLADRGGAAIETVLDAGTTIRLEGEIDDSHLKGFRWLRSFWLATVTRERRARDTLLATSVPLTGPRRHTQGFELHFIEAIRAHADGRDASAAIRAALDATASSQLDADWLQMIDRPRIAVAARVFARDAKAADAALLEAFERHRSYWERPSKAKDDAGWLALSLAALMVIARDAGLVLETTSDYAPEALLAPYELLLADVELVDEDRIRDRGRT